MNDQRNLTIGVDFGLKDSINQLESIYGSIQGIKAGFQGTEDSGVQMGSRVARSAGTMADGLHDADRESREGLRHWTGWKIPETGQAPQSGMPELRLTDSAIRQKKMSGRRRMSCGTQ